MHKKRRSVKLSDQENAGKYFEDTNIEGGTNESIESLLVENQVLFASESRNGDVSNKSPYSNYLKCNLNEPSQSKSGLLISR